MGKSTISMAILKNYVSLPEGIPISRHKKNNDWNRSRIFFGHLPGLLVFRHQQASWSARIQPVDQAPEHIFVHDASQYGISPEA